MEEAHPEKIQRHAVGEHPVAAGGLWADGGSRVVYWNINTSRRDSIDCFRGLTIMLMVVVNLLADVSSVPAWLKHKPDTGITFVDVIAPAFLFVIGLTYRASLVRRRERDGTAAIGHFVRRWLAIIGIGAVISVGEGFTGATGRIVDWGVLQAIGLAGLLALPFVSRPAWIRLVAGGLVLAVYQLGFALAFGDQVLHSSHGGLWGSLSWTGMLLISTVFGDLLNAGESRSGRDFLAVVLAAAFIGAGMLLALVVPVSKPRVSASYGVLSVGVSALIFWALFLPAERRGIRVPLLTWWGRNPLVLYVSHYVLLGLIVLPGVNWWHEGASGMLAAAQCLVLVIVLSLLAWQLSRRSVVVSL